MRGFAASAGHAAASRVKNIGGAVLQNPASALYLPVMTSTDPVFRCSYCLQSKPEAERSDEHIWPESLGGDPLGPPWRTSNVCERCNHLAGRWVDGQFVRSFFGSHERVAGAEDYLDPENPLGARTHFAYLGVIQSALLTDEETAEAWLGPAGDVVIHVRPRHDEAWDAFAGGKPTRKRSQGGRAYLLLASEEPFWIKVVLSTFLRAFRHASRTIANADISGPPTLLTPITPADATQARHLRIVDENRKGVHGQMTLPLDVERRFLAKLALGVGRETLGEAFLSTPYATLLARMLREADFEKRNRIPLRGASLHGGLKDAVAKLPLHWPGGWVLLLLRPDDRAALVIVTPAENALALIVSDDPALTIDNPAWPDEGVVYLTIPALDAAVGPIGLPDYLAFQTGVSGHPELERLAARRTDPSRLPPKRKVS